MKPTTSLIDYMEFKDEIMKRIRLLENKFTSEFNAKFSAICSNFEKIELKIAVITQNNSTLIEQLTKQNYYYEKFSEFYDFKSKAENDLVMHEIKIKNILQDIGKLKIRYDRIINENLIVPGYVGPGSQHKNLAEYIIYQISEFQKIRNDTEQTKNKVDNSSKIAMGVLNNSLAQFQRYTDEKNKDTQFMLERKYMEFSEKILQLEAELNKYQYKIEKQMKPIQGDIQKLIKIKNSPVVSSEQKIDDINLKIKALEEEFAEIRQTNKEWENKIFNIKQNSNSSEILNIKNLSKYKVANKINNEVNSSKILISRKNQNLKSSKNLIKLSENEQKISSNNNTGLPKFNSELASPKRSNFSFLKLGEFKSENNEELDEGNFEDINNRNIEDKKLIYIQKKEKQKDKKEEENIKLNNSEEFSLSKGDLNENETKKINKILSEEVNNTLKK